MHEQAPSDATAYHAHVAAQLGPVRRRAAAESAELFAHLYLAAHFALPPSRMHRRLLELVEQLPADEGRRIAIAAPRGHAKTTIMTLAAVLWLILNGHEPFVLLVSATCEQAKQLLDAMKRELQDNPLLQADYPELCGPNASRRRWRGDRIELANGAAVQAVGAGQSFRGLKHGRHRPSLIVVDDLEQQDAVQSSEQRAKLRDWFDGTLLKAGTPPTNVVVVGTVFHHDSLLSRLLDGKRTYGWSQHRYQAIEAFAEHGELWAQWERIYRGEAHHGTPEATGPAAATGYFQAHRTEMLAGAQVLWPARYDYHQLMVQRLREGRMSFAAEMQNEPVHPSQCVVHPESIAYWDEEHRTPADVLEALGRDVIICGACDPALGRQDTGDYTAIVTVARHRRTGRVYVLDAEIRHLAPSETIERILQLARTYRYGAFAIEANHFQTMLVEDLKRRIRGAGRPLRVHEVRNKANKYERITGLETLISQGSLLFSRRQELLIQQLTQFPYGAHDDGPDALEMAVGVAHHASADTVVRLNPRTGAGLGMSREQMDEIFGEKQPRRK